VPARTDTARLSAFVDHTQITKVASWPALTSPAPESDWTRTHSCGVTFLCFFGLGVWLGFGLGELDVGLGFGEGELELGFGEGDPDELEWGEDDAAGLDEWLALADTVGEGDLLLLAVAVGELADLNRDEELASAAVWWLVASFVADDSVVLFGMIRHSVGFAVDWLLASAECNSANALQPMNANPTSAPTAAGLSINALTCESSCAFWLR
jgi:hypothetical protein